MSKKQLEEVVVEVLEETTDERTLNLITLSSGVVLKAKQAPPLALVKVLAAFPRPKPPVYMNKQMGREMENPEDPEYIEKLKAHRMESSNAVLNALILLGTELVSVPKGFSKPADQEWLDEFQLLGLPSRPENASWRYLTWVTQRAVLSEDDLLKIQEAVGRLSGVTEAAVKSAESFSGSGTNGKV